MISPMFFQFAFNQLYMYAVIITYMLLNYFPSLQFHYFIACNMKFLGVIGTMFVQFAFDPSYTGMCWTSQFANIGCSVYF